MDVYMQRFKALTPKALFFCSIYEKNLDVLTEYLMYGLHSVWVWKVSSLSAVVTAQKEVLQCVKSRFNFLFSQNNKY